MRTSSWGLSVEEAYYAELIDVCDTHGIFWDRMFAIGLTDGTTARDAILFPRRKDLERALKLLRKRRDLGEIRMDAEDFDRADSALIWHVGDSPACCFFQYHKPRS